MENQIKALDHLINELFKAYHKRTFLFLDDTWQVSPHCEGFINVECDDVAYYIPSEGFHGFNDKYEQELQSVDLDKHLDLYAYISHFLQVAYHANPELFTTGLGPLFEQFGCAFFLIKNEEAHNA